MLAQLPERSSCKRWQPSWKKQLSHGTIFEQLLWG
jgi:hypothetical protein